MRESRTERDSPNATQLPVAVELRGGGGFLGGAAEDDGAEELGLLDRHATLAGHGEAGEEGGDVGITGLARDFVEMYFVALVKALENSLGARFDRDAPNHWR